MPMGRKLAVGSLLLVWGVGLVWAFWWFEGRHVRVFTTPAHFQAQPATPPYPTGQVQVVHVWQKGCPCNAGHEDYLRQMTEQYAAQGVAFAWSGASAQAPPEQLRNWPYWPIPKEWPDWPGAPAILIWNAQGELAYVGPYSESSYCTPGNSLVEPVMRALLDGREVRITSQDTLSCLCDLSDR